MSEIVNFNAVKEGAEKERAEREARNREAWHLFHEQQERRKAEIQSMLDKLGDLTQKQKHAEAERRITEEQERAAAEIRKRVEDEMGIPDEKKRNIMKGFAESIMK